MDELKPCPFCGAEGKAVYLEFDGERVWCKFCSALGPPGSCADDENPEYIEMSAVWKWNRRAKNAI